MGKSIKVNGYEFVTNNFAAILDNQSAPDSVLQGAGLLESQPHWLCFDST